MKAKKLTSYNIIVGLCVLLSHIMVSTSLSAPPSRNGVFDIGGPLALPLTHGKAVITRWSFFYSLKGTDQLIIYENNTAADDHGHYVTGDTLRKDAVQFQDAGKYTATVKSTADSTQTYTVAFNVYKGPSCTTKSCTIKYSGPSTAEINITGVVISSDGDTNITKKDITCVKKTDVLSVAPVTLQQLSCSINQGLTCSDCVCTVSWKPIDPTIVKRYGIDDGEYPDSSALKCRLAMSDSAETIHGNAPDIGVNNDTNTPGANATGCACCHCGFMICILLLLLYIAAVISFPLCQSLNFRWGWMPIARRVDPQVDDGNPARPR